MRMEVSAFSVLVKLSNESHTANLFPNIHYFDRSVIIVLHARFPCMWIESQFSSLLLCVACLSEYAVPDFIRIFQIYLDKKENSYKWFRCPWKCDAQNLR